MEAKDVNEHARGLIGTSVDDLRSSLYFYDGSSPVHEQIIEHGLQICERRGEKTKATMLRRKLRNLKKEAEKKQNLQLLEKARKTQMALENDHQKNEVDDGR